jgi:hypothetical protein
MKFDNNSSGAHDKPADSLSVRHKGNRRRLQGHPRPSPKTSRTIRWKHQTDRTSMSQVMPDTSRPPGLDSKQEARGHSSKVVNTPTR